MSDRVQIIAALAQPGERWYPGLAASLAARKWAALANRGFDTENYGTTRILEADPTASRTIKGVLRGASGSTIVEAFGAAMTARYGPLGVVATGDSLISSAALDRLSRAVALAHHAPGLSDTISVLVRSVHLIDVEAPEYDASYSDPDVPFSIFVGMHPEPIASDTLRLAESIVHEAMHLQLTLIEDQVPLVGGAGELAHSPWQGRPRPTQGLLHGLYVFRAIQDFLAAIPSEELDAADARHVQRRLALIDAECAELATLSTSSDLTSEGKAFARSLLSDRQLLPSTAA